MYQTYKLSNGITVITENISYVRSVSLGIWIKAGSIHENADNNGITHFIEHMLFKGTGDRTAKEIAESIDNIGGQLNAFTSKEYTCYYAKVLDSHVDVAIDVLTDMLLCSTLHPKEIEKEKSVILEEISMYEDSPEDIAHDLLLKTAFPQHSLGLPILGVQDTIKNFSRNDLVHYMEDHYTIDNIIISIVGNFKEEEIIHLLEKKFSNSSVKNNEQKLLNRPTFVSNTVIRYKNIEQLHLCIGFEGTSLASKELYPLLLMNNIFGGSISSRLFQSIREEKGLAYSVFSYPSAYTQTGLFTIYVGMNPSQLQEVCKLINEQIARIRCSGLTEEELLKSKEQLKGNYILGLDSIDNRMTAIGKSKLLLDSIYSQSEIVQEIDQVTLEEVNSRIDQLFHLDKATMVAVGKMDEQVDLNSLLKI
jgi:predicted Zn-dependent peptidase